MRKIGQNLRGGVAPFARLDWHRLFIEFLVVVAGVFVGMQVSNWNEARQERRETLRLLDQLQPELQSILDYEDELVTYYDNTAEAVAQAFAGWRGDPAISDEAFVTGAYQASRYQGKVTNIEIWADIFGAGQVRDIKDTRLREALIDILTIDSSVGDWRQLDSEYRRELRGLIPEEMQAVLARDCAEVVGPCESSLDEADFAETAAILRDRPDLVQKLRQQQSVVAVFRYNQGVYSELVEDLSREIDRVRG